MNNREHAQYFNEINNNHKTLDDRMNANTFDNILSNGVIS